jgi:hypothetical protein
MPLSVLSDVPQILVRQRLLERVFPSALTNAKALAIGRPVQKKGSPIYFEFKRTIDGVNVAATLVEYTADASQPLSDEVANG